MKISKYQPVLKILFFSIFLLNTESSRAGLLERVEELREESARFSIGTSRLVILMEEKERIASRILEKIIPILGETISRSSLIKSLSKAIQGISKDSSIPTILGRNLHDEDIKLVVDFLAGKTASFLRMKKIKELESREPELMKTLHSEIFNTLFQRKM